MLVPHARHRSDTERRLAALLRQWALGLHRERLVLGLGLFLGRYPFHYGRWIREPRFGWLWVPDLTWGPAWVCWRHAETDGYIGWAPLPYGAVWVGGGWRYHNRAVVEVGFDFGLGEDFFVFVGHDHFHDHYFRYRSRVEYPFHVHREIVHGFYGRTVLRNEFRRNEHGRFVNEGLGRARIERVTGHKV